MSIEALDFVYRAEIVSENAVRLHMKNPQHIETGRDVSLNGHHFTVHTVDTGAPHVVLFVEDLEVQDVHETGRGLRHHAAFAPSGANVNFVKVTGASSIALRTYERGVEAETLACGTGSVASAIISSIVQGTQNPVTIRVRSGEDLLVSFTLKDKSYYDVSLQGGALILFSGNILYDANRGIVGVASVSEL